MREPAICVFLGMPAVISSQPMRQLMEQVRRVAQVDAAVLITGESGVGKELVARALHHYSPRAEHPWVDVSCAALPEHLVESELFGHERGAFSSADAAKPGLFELADKGTLFLDEIGELEPRMQVKLLRVLDRVSYYRLGGTRKISVDVRVVAATNQDLGQKVSDGRFRADLYHRLSEIQMEIPPLRERKEEIAPLAEYFLRQTRPDGRFSAGARRALEKYDWPGNVRELKNTVLKAAVLAPGPRIGAEDLPLPVRDAAGSLQALAASVSANGGSGGQEWRLDLVERRMIFQALEKTGGHHQNAADLLGISRRTLSRKLKLYATEPVNQDRLAERLR